MILPTVLSVPCFGAAFSLELTKAVLFLLAGIACYLFGLRILYRQFLHAPKFHFPSSDWEWPTALVILGLFFFLPGLISPWLSSVSLPSCFTIEKEKIAPDILRKLDPIPHEGEEILPITEDDFTDSSPIVQEFDRQHPVTKLLVLAKQSGHFSGIVFLILLTSVVFVPINEEFIFRFLLPQTIGRYTKEGKRALSILLPSLFFAVIHIRSTSSLTWNGAQLLLRGIILITPITSIGTVVLGWGLIYQARGRLFRLPAWRQIGNDLLLGAVALAIFLPTLFFVQKGLLLCAPTMITDPIPLFLFAIELGLITQWTERLTPAIGMHASLNLFSFVMILLTA